MRRGVLFLAAALLAGVLVAAARANHIPGALYTGSHSGGGAIEFQVSADGKTITRFKFSRVPIPLGSFGTCYVTRELVASQLGGGIPINNHTFSYRATQGSETVSFSGSFTGPQQASGSIELDEGSVLVCGGSVSVTTGTWKSGKLTWTASTQSHPPSPPSPPSQPPPPPAKPAPSAGTKKKPSKPPKILRHADVRAEATSPRGAIVKYRPATVRGATSVKYSKASGTLFPLGPTTVTIVAKNRRGTSRATFKVTVADTTAPTFGPTTDTTVTASSASGANVTYPAITATDVVDPHVSVSCSPPSGSLFPVGTTTVTCSARDASGNSAAATFKVVVNPALPPGVVPNRHYAGTTSQGKNLSFDILSDGATIANFQADISAPCSPSGTLTGTLPVTATVSVQPDGTFSSGPLAGTFPVNGIPFSFTGSGQGAFDASGTATGTFQVHASGDLGGTHYECDTGTVTWTAR